MFFSSWYLFFHRITNISVLYSLKYPIGVHIINGIFIIFLLFYFNTAVVFAMEPNIGGLVSLGEGLSNGGLTLESPEVITLIGRLNRVQDPARIETIRELLLIISNTYNIDLNSVLYPHLQYQNNQGNQGANSGVLPNMIGPDPEPTNWREVARTMGIFTVFSISLILVYRNWPTLLDFFFDILPQIPIVRGEHLAAAAQRICQNPQAAAALLLAIENSGVFYSPPSA